VIKVGPPAFTSNSFKEMGGATGFGGFGAIGGCAIAQDNSEINNAQMKQNFFMAVARL
jgi:hypothetical protein